MLAPPVKDYFSKVFDRIRALALQTLAVVKTRPRVAKKPAESATLPKDIDVDSALRTRVPRSGWRPNALWAWRYDEILGARNLQARGSFALPARLGTSLKTDAIVYSALLNRLAPARGLPRIVSAPAGANDAIRLEAELKFARDGTAISPAVTADNSESRAVHGLAIGRNIWTPRDDGTRIDVALRHWPIECVERDMTDGELYALTQAGRERIVHGDGTWVVFQLHERKPETWGAIMPLAMLWADRAFAIRDRSRNLESHGDDKWIGTMPEGIPTKGPEGDEMLDQLEALYEARRVMLLPFGGSVQRNEAMSQAWQIFKETILADDKDVQRIFLGQDGTMTNTGGNYIKDWGMFGVRNDIVEGDLRSDQDSITTGVLRPWSIANFGRWDRLKYEYQWPDADQDTRRESLAKRHDDFDRIVAARRTNKFIVDQSFCDRLAKELGIEAPALEPTLPSALIPPSTS